MDKWVLQTSRFWLLFAVLFSAAFTPGFAQDAPKAHVRLVVVDGLGDPKPEQKPELDEKTKAFRKVLMQANLQFNKYVMRKNVQTELSEKERVVDLGNQYKLKISGKIVKKRVQIQMVIVKMTKKDGKPVETVVLNGKVAPKFGCTQSICLPMDKRCCKKVLIITADKKPIEDKSSTKLEAPKKQDSREQ